MGFPEWQNTSRHAMARIGGRLASVQVEHPSRGELAIRRWPVFPIARTKG